MYTSQTYITRKKEAQRQHNFREAWKSISKSLPLLRKLVDSNKDIENWYYQLLGELKSFNLPKKSKHYNVLKCFYNGYNNNKELNYIVLSSTISRFT